MPFQNTGTLLENIVLLESMRYSFSMTDGLVDFVNCFTMPPLAPWKTYEKNNDCFRNAHFAKLHPPECELSTSYADLMSACRRYRADAGPNGALLCSLLAAKWQRRIRCWLNDVEDGRYDNALGELGKLNTITQSILYLTSPIDQQNELCSIPYPSCLGALETFLATTSKSQCRLGFLDPMKYDCDDARPGRTSSTDHKKWLKILTHDFAGVVISVHFTANNEARSLTREIAGMLEDLKTSGFETALVAANRYFRVVLGVSGNADQKNANTIASEIKLLIENAWRDWQAAIGRARCKLEVEQHCLIQVVN